MKTPTVKVKVSVAYHLPRYSGRQWRSHYHQKSPAKSPPVTPAQIPPSPKYSTTKEDPVELKIKKRKGKKDKKE